MNQGSFDPSVEYTFSQGVRRELFKDVFYSATDYSGNRNDYRGRNIAGSGSHRFTFYVPDDFESLDTLVLVGIAAATVVDVDIDLHSDYALAGQDSQVNSESDVVSTFSFTVNEITEQDITTVFSNLAAGHYCGIFVDHNAIGTTVTYLGIRLRYRRAT